MRPEINSVLSYLCCHLVVPFGEYIKQPLVSYQDDPARWQNKCNKALLFLASWHRYLLFIFLKFVFLQHWPVGCAGCSVLGQHWQTNLYDSFGQQFFSRPRYIVNSSCQALDELRMNIRYSALYLFYTSLWNDIITFMSMVQLIQLNRYWARKITNDVFDVIGRRR